MEKRPIYVSVFVCAICFLYSIITNGADYLLGWGYFFVGGLLLQNYLMKEIMIHQKNIIIIKMMQIIITAMILLLLLPIQHTHQRLHLGCAQVASRGHAVPPVMKVVSDRTPTFRRIFKDKVYYVFFCFGQAAPDGLQVCVPHLLARVRR